VLLYYLDPLVCLSLHIFLIDQLDVVSHYYLPFSSIYFTYYTLFCFLEAKNCLVRMYILKTIFRIKIPNAIATDIRENSNDILKTKSYILIHKFVVRTHDNQ